MGEVSQVLEQQQTFDLVVWLQESRGNLETISNLLIDTQLIKKNSRSSCQKLTTI